MNKAQETIDAVREQRALERLSIVYKAEKELIMFDAETRRMLEEIGVSRIMKQDNTPVGSD